MWHGGTWQYGEWTGKYGLDFFEEVTFSLIPGGGDNGQANTLTHPLVYLVTTQEDEDAMAISAELIAIASEPRINALHAIKSAHLGITPEESTVGLYAGDRWAREATAVLLPNATAAPNHVNFGQYFEVMFGGLQAAWTGQKTVDEAIADMETELKASLGDKIVIR
jgi:inositol-phosphate transport system substrate-binding protein